MVIGTGIVFWAQASQLYMCTSVPQIDVLRTRMRTSSPPTSGTGTSSSQSPGSALALHHRLHRFLHDEKLGHRFRGLHADLKRNSAEINLREMPA